MAPTALIVIGLLRDFVDGVLCNPRARQIVPPLVRLLEHARGAGWVVVFANDAHEPGDPELRVWGEHALDGTAGVQTIDELAPRPGERELVVPKRAYGAFDGTGLDERLRRLGVERVVLAGQHTHICVRHSAYDALIRGYEIAVPRDAVCAFAGVDEEAALDYLRTVYGAVVTTVAELVAEPIARAEAGPRANGGPWPDGAESGLLLDLYELTMGQSYFDQGMHERPATFSLFARRLPPGWGFLVAAGLDSTLRYLEGLRFTSDDLAFLERTGLFTPAFLDHLGGLRFGGDVRAMPEGTPFFPQEPVLEVDAGLLEAQLVETLVVNHVHFQSLVAGKATRCVEAAAGRSLVDFGMRRTHGEDAALKDARVAYLAGFDATSDVLAGRRYGIPLAGTMAHSHVQAFACEGDSFAAFLASFPRGATLLVDTYDTLAGVERAIEAARAAGVALHAVRLDSGDFLELSLATRRLLDAAGLESTTIFASGNLDEHKIARLVDAGAPIDGFGVGSRLGTVADAPYLDMAYKLVAIDGRPTLKLSSGKATWPCPKQVWRRAGGAGTDGVVAAGAAGDVISHRDEAPVPGATPLLQPAMARGRRLVDEPLVEARARARAERERLPQACRSLSAEPFPVSFSPELVRRRDELARALAPSVPAGTA